MKNIFRSLMAGVMILALSGPSVAGDFTLVPANITGGCPGCTSPVGNVFGFTFLGTSFIDYTTGTGTGVGDQFNDYGALSATALTSAPSTPIISALTGVNNNWQFGAIFDTLQGANTSVTGDEVEFGFTPFAGQIQLYAEPINLGGPHDPNNPGTIADGALVATLELLSGTGDFDFQANDGRVNLVAQFSSIDPDFWQHLGLPIDLGSTIFLAITDSNNNLITAPDSTITNFDNFFGTSSGNAPSDHFFVSNDGSVQFAVVPEPSTMLLFGTGLIGIGFILRRRGNKK